MFKSIYNLVQKYEDRNKIVRLDNVYYEIDPSSWKENMDVNIEVGIGYGNQDIKVQAMTNLSTMLQQVAPQIPGLVTPENAYNFVRNMATELGIKNIDKFISVPPPPQQEGPSAQDQLAQAQAQALIVQAQAQQLEAEVKAKELELKAAKVELERVEIEHEMAVKREELKLKGIELGFEMNSDKNIKA